MENIETIVDTLLKKRTLVRKPKHRHKVLRIPTIVGIVVMLCVVGGLSALIYYYSAYDVETSGDIDLEGNPPLLRYDGDALLEEVTVTDMDVTSLVAGDNFEFSHTLESVSGDWDCYFDTSDIEMHEEEYDFYGFYFTVEDDSENEITYVEALEGTTVTFYYDYSLDENFAETLCDFPFLLNLDIVAYVPPPDPGDDSYTRDWGIEVIDEAVCVNDVIYQGTMEILNTFNENKCTVTAIGDCVISYIIDEGESSASFEYTLGDGFKTGTALVTITGVAP